MEVEGDAGHVDARRDVTKEGLGDILIACCLSVSGECTTGVAK